MTSIEIAGSVILLIVALMFYGGGGRNAGSRTWSGDTRDEEARRNTRTDSNYQGWQSDRSRGDC